MLTISLGSDALIQILLEERRKMNSPPGSHCFITLETVAYKNNDVVTSCLDFFAMSERLFSLQWHFAFTLFRRCFALFSSFATTKSHKLNRKNVKHCPHCRIQQTITNYRNTRLNKKWMHLQSYSTKFSSADAYSQVLENSQSNFVWFSQLSFLLHWDSRTLYHLHTLIHSWTA